MTRRSAQPPSGLHAPVAENGFKRVITTGSHSPQASTSTGVVDGGKIAMRPMQGNIESNSTQMRHEEYMRRRARAEKRRERAERIYGRLTMNLTNESGDDEVEQAGKEAYGNVEMVKRPSHYNQNGIECIDAIHAALGDEGFINYCHGNCLKYTWRWQRKGGLTDLDKSTQYAEFIKNVSNGKPPRG